MVYRTVLALSAIAASTAQKPEVSIGVPDQHQKYPYVVTFIREHQRACSGTLIASNWVLTAGECTFYDGEYQVQYGNLSVLPSQAKLVSKVVQAVQHPSLRAGNGREDQSTRSHLQLVLVETIPLKQYAHISAIDYKSLTGIAVEYASLQLSYPLEPDPDKMAPENALRTPLVGQGIIISCDSETYMGIGLDGPMMCVASTCENKFQLAWSEDSGGPLFYGGKVIGVLQGVSNLPAKRYAAVSPFIDWIHLVMTQNKPDALY